MQRISLENKEPPLPVLSHVSFLRQVAFLQNTIYKQIHQVTYKQQSMGAVGQ